jgi:iron-sulfur cluster assembly accessory protein
MGIGGIAGAHPRRLNCHVCPAVDPNRVRTYLQHDPFELNRIMLWIFWFDRIFCGKPGIHFAGKCSIWQTTCNGRAMTAVTLSERAARRIGEILKSEPAGAMLRVSVEGGGCSGFQYKFDFDTASTADDLVLTRDGAVVVIDPVSVQYMAGAEIDYVDDLIGASFKIKNPVATASCGCGTSFSV